jgi:hypothetical protein
VNSLFEISADDVADTSDDCYTPRWVFDAAGLVFDIDVAAPVDPARRTCPATRYLTPVEDGLTQPWEGLVWMNPPYSNPSPWTRRFAQHGNGLALVRATKRCGWMGPLLGCADGITLLLDVSFARPDGSLLELMNPLILAACGPVAVGALARVAAADKYVKGAYHVRPS